MKHHAPKRFPKLTTHLTRAMHIVRLPIRNAAGKAIDHEPHWRLFELRNGIDQDDLGRPIWVQTHTFTPEGAEAFINAFREARSTTHAKAGREARPDGRGGPRPLHPDRGAGREGQGQPQAV